MRLCDEKMARSIHVGEIYAYLPRGDDKETHDEAMSTVEVLAVRPAMPTASSEADQSAIAYFVHFLGTDKRLDKWVTPECIGEQVQRQATTSNSHKRGASGSLRLNSSETRGGRGNG